jgi:hypothetical protein
MQFKLGSILTVALIAIVVLVGCEVTRDMVMDTMPSTDTEMTDVMMPSTDTEMADMGAVPVKLVWLVNYPVGGKADYLAWIAAVAPTLLAPEELNRVASYDNARGESPHRLVEFEFDSYVDAATYLSRPDVAAVFEALPDQSSEVSTHVFVQRSADYSKDENPTRTVKLVYLVDYPLGGKDAYLEWIASVAPSLQAPEEVKRIASYDNLHGASPHRFVEFEFESVEEAHTYLEREAPRAVNTELPNQSSRVSQLLFEQRPDYNE